MSSVPQRAVLEGAPTEPLAAKLHALRLMAPVLAGAMHVVQALVFLPMWPWLSAASVGSCVWFVGVWWLIARAGRPRMGTALVWFEVSLHSAVLTILLGLGAGYALYWLVIAAGPFLMFRSEERERWALSAASVVGGLALVAFTDGRAPLLEASPIVLAALGWMNLVGAGLALVAIVAHSARETERAELALAREQARSEALLYNTLPRPIVERLKHEPGVIADQVDGVCVLFADIVGFTPLAATLSGKALVSMLDELFRRFDRLAAEHRLEKIKTIGDAYMVVGGVPEPHAEPVAAMARMALGMRAAVADYATEHSLDLDVRIGMHTGPVVAGVIGEQRFSYDLWGDTVNVASRMESHGQRGRIQVTDAVADVLRGTFDLEDRGEIEVKGRGRLRAWFLEA